VKLPRFACVIGLRPVRMTGITTGLQGAQP
jgi:hypothetical protein